MAEESNTAGNRRGQLWINSRVQSYLLIHGLIFGAYFLVIFGVVEFFFFERLKVDLDAAGLDAANPWVRFFFDYQWTKVMVIIALSIAVMLVSFLQMLYVSHRICGPVYKLTRFLENKIRHPESSDELRFRKNDYFVEVASAANELFEKYDLVPKKKS